MAYVTDGLQLYLDAKDYSGTTSIWSDLSGNGNNGILTNFNYNSDGWENNSLRVDGVDDYVSIPNSSSLNISTNEITVEVYFSYLKNSSSALVSKNYTSSYHLSLDDNGINWWTNNGNLTATASLKGTGYYHITATVKSDGTKLIYLNGSLVASGIGSLSTSTDNVFIGNSFLSQYFGGRIKTVRIYNRALSESEIIQNYNATNIGTNFVKGLTFTSNNIWSNPSYVTDGIESNSINYTDNSSGVLTWIQFDLGFTKCINNVNIWRYWEDSRSYHDVIVQLSNDSSFESGVTTIFNNDTDNSAGLGVGTDSEYVETFFGKTISADNINARYVRIYSNGSTVNTSNHYVEIEVYGNSLLSDIDLVGLISSNTTIQGTLNIIKNLSGSINDLISVTADLSNISNLSLSGIVNSTVTIQINLSVTKDLLGNTNSPVNIEALLSITKLLNSNISSTSNLNAIISKNINLISNVDSLISITSTLTNIGNSGLNANISIFSSSESELNITKNLIVSCSLNSSANSQLSTTKLLNVNINSIANINSSLTIINNKLLSGNITSYSNLQSNLNIIKNLSGSCNSSSNTSLYFVIIKLLNGNINSTSTVILYNNITQIVIAELEMILKNNYDLDLIYKNSYDLDMFCSKLVSVNMNL